MPRFADRSVWAWAALGLAGSALIALAGPHVAGGPVRWWFDPSLGVAVFYVGIAALSVAWLALGRLAIGTRQVWIVAAAWCLPLFLTAPLFSQDAYSYLAQGTIVHLGLDPYRDAPAVLASHGQAHVLNAVSPFWRHTTAPYGPLFLWIVSWFSGASPVVGVLLIRRARAPRVRLARGVRAASRPRERRRSRARRLAGAAQSARAAELVAAAHNDLLMIGLVVAGIAFAIERRVLLGIALCALAATIKLPAAAAIPFILVGVAADRRTVWQALLLTVGVVLAVSVVSGLGLGWISSAVFSTPAKVRLAITPATALGWTVAQVVPGGGAGA